MRGAADGGGWFTGRRQAALLTSCVALAILFAFLIRTARTSVLHEVRAHAMGVATALAAGLSAEDLEEIRGPGDTSRPAYVRLQERMGRVRSMLPDIRYVYTMRPDPRPGARPTDFVYVVDGPPEDADRDGMFGEDERSEPPGAPYDATEYPAMREALERPAADAAIRPDPPYPDLISGYAPVRDAQGRSVGIVGVDITAATVRAKLAGIYAVNLGCGALLMTLLALLARLHFRQEQALEENRALAAELAVRNRDLARRNEQMQAELKLAQQVQLGFLPRDFPRHDRLVFDRYYITSDILGGDLFDVFAIDDDRIALYMADVAGHGVSAALISGLLKMAVTSLRDPRRGGDPETAQPGVVLARLNELLRQDLPDCEFITMAYALLDLKENRIEVASAGHPPPFVVESSSGRVEAWNLNNGLALGLLPGQQYPVARRGMRAGDRLVFYTDGLIEAMDADGGEFGEERALEILRGCASASPADLLETMRRAVEQHRGSAAVSDDFSMLICSLG